MILDKKELQRLVRYCPESGKLYWQASNHPKQIVGKEIGSINDIGYHVLSVHKNVLLAHRLIWFLYYGEWPTGVIDHINLIRSDNRISNLRDTTRRVNQENRIAAQSNSSTKLLGAFTYGNRFRSQIKACGKLYHLGVFNTSEEAHAAYIKAKRQLHEGNTL